LTGQEKSDNNLAAAETIIQINSITAVTGTKDASDTVTEIGTFTGLMFYSFY